MISIALFQQLAEFKGIDLGSFSSFFELFTAFNLAYSVVEAFRHILNDEVLEINYAVRRAKKTREIATVQLRMYRSAPLPNADSRILIQAARRATAKIAALVRFDRRFSEYPAGFKSAFLMSGIYCLFVLLQNGFVQFVSLDEGTVRRSLGSLTVLLFLYNLIVLIRSFRRQSVSRNIQPIVTLVYFSICLAICYVYLTFFRTIPGSRSSDFYIAILAIFFASSAFIFHFARAFFHKFITRYLAVTYLTQVDESLTELGRQIYGGFQLPVTPTSKFSRFIIRLKYCFAARLEP